MLLLCINEKKHVLNSDFTDDIISAELIFRFHSSLSAGL